MMMTQTRRRFLTTLSLGALQPSYAHHERSPLRGRSKPPRCALCERRHSATRPNLSWKTCCGRKASPISNMCLGHRAPTSTRQS